MDVLLFRIYYFIFVLFEEAVIQRPHLFMSVLEAGVLIPGYEERCLQC